MCVTLCIDFSLDNIEKIANIIIALLTLVLGCFLKSIIQIYQK